jgi:hypothetical protein
LIFENEETRNAIAAGLKHSTRRAITSGDPSERFFLKETQGNGYHLTNMYTSHLLAVDNGGRLIMEPTPSTRQEWYLDMVDRYTAKLRNAVKPELVLGQQLKLEEDGNRLSQRWRILGLRELEQLYR